MRSLLLGSVLMFAAAGAMGQLPAGARDANDNSRAEALNAKLREAEAALEKGDYAAAAKTLQALEVERPKDPQILYDLGFAEERIGEDENASKAYEGAIAAAPDVVEPQLALGLLDARAGRTDKAHAELLAVAQQQSASPQLRGRALRALAQIDERTHPADASEELLDAIKLTGETADDTALSARLAEHAGDPGGAEAAYRRNLQAHPDDVEAATGLAHILLQTKRAVEAESVLDEPLKAHPDNPVLVSQMASVYAAEGKPEQAIPLLVQLRTDPRFAEDVTLARQLARLYAVGGKNTEAEGLFKVVLAKDPEDATVLDDLGSVLVREQKYAEAEKVLGQAVALRDRFPTPADFGEAASHLAFAAFHNNQPREALQALKLRATVLPNSGSSLFLEAISHDALHENKEAIQAYRAFLVISTGQLPDEEFEAKHRLIALEHTK